MKIFKIYLLLAILVLGNYANAGKEEVELLSNNYSLASKNNLIEAEVAFSKKSLKRLQDLLEIENEPQVKEVINYWRLLVKSYKAGKTELENAIDNSQSPVIAENLGRQWVNIAGSRKDYLAVIDYYSQLEEPYNENDCYHAIAQYHHGSKIYLQNLVEDTWINNFFPGAGCREAHALLVSMGYINNTQLKKRLRQNVYRRLSTEFKLINNINFPQGISQTSLFKNRKQLATILPKVLKKVNLPKQKSNLQESLVLASIALIAEDEDLAANFFENYREYFNDNSQSVICGFLTYKFSQNFKIQALKYYKCAPANIDSVLLDKQIETIIRYFIRKERYSTVKKLITSLTAEKQDKSSWIYWQARITLQQENVQIPAKTFNNLIENPDKFDNKNLLDAAIALNKIRSRPSFYGALANEYFGNNPEIPQFTIPNTQIEIDHIASIPCFQWASFLISVGGEVRRHGTYEWIDCVKRNLTSDREKLAASRYALSQNIFDRTINTAILTENEHDWRLRFITPFKEEIQKGAIEQNLSLELIYGLIRQESRFIIDARSVSGAMGLMQIMPKTGAWLAKNLEYKPYQRSMLEDTSTNVYFGTSYIRMILDKTNHPVLMCASYNAGPTRARRWMRKQDYIDAVAYIESIPFKETRNYVQNVLWNATIYQIILGNKKAKVSDWLYPITSEHLLSNKHLP